MFLLGFCVFHMRLPGGALAYKERKVKYNHVSDLHCTQWGHSFNGKSIVLHLQSFLEFELRCALRVCNALYRLYRLTISEMVTGSRPYSLSIPLITKSLNKQSYMPLPFSVGGKYDRIALWLQNLRATKRVSCWSCFELTRWDTRVHRVFRYSWQGKSLTKHCKDMIQMTEAARIVASSACKRAASAQRISILAIL